MELRQLRYFLTVADSRSFVSAAERLFVSRQAVSKAVSLLEEELRTELFMRNSNGAFLTPSGVMFYERVRNIVLDLDRISEEMQTNKYSFRQRIRLGFAPCTLALYEDALCEFAREQNNIDITYSEYSEKECLRMISGHELDLAVTGVPTEDSAAGNWQLCSSSIGLLSKQLPEQEDYTRDYGTLEEDQLLGVLERLGHPAAYRGYDLNRLCRLADAGKCSLLLPEMLVPKERKGEWHLLPGAPEWELRCNYLKNTVKNSFYRVAIDTFTEAVFHIDTARKEYSHNG